ncbi:hypothetical protein TNCV_1125031 [Trichonephila clavipes]|uniref:Uncharacterized protein n=1 Tax=Trichonephila clavipes TaxID=2585209 RepID=A0A8X6SBM9_TRICX|nr:hypothetical protein TNCV_1125031 [Trichonephila clavipes]
MERDTEMVLVLIKLMLSPSNHKFSNTKSSNTKSSNTKSSNTKSSNTKSSNTKSSNTKSSNTKSRNTKSRNTKSRNTITPDQLWQRMEAAWSAVPQEHTQSLFKSMLRRVAEVISNNGGYSGY